MTTNPQTPRIFKPPGRTVGQSSSLSRPLVQNFYGANAQPNTQISPEASRLGQFNQTDLSQFFAPCSSNYLGNFASPLPASSVYNGSHSGYDAQTASYSRHQLQQQPLGTSAARPNGNPCNSLQQFYPLDQMRSQSVMSGISTILRSDNDDQNLFLSSPPNQGLPPARTSLDSALSSLNTPRHPGVAAASPPQDADQGAVTATTGIKLYDSLQPQPGYTAVGLFYERVVELQKLKAQANVPAEKLAHHVAMCNQRLFFKHCLQRAIRLSDLVLVQKDPIKTATALSEIFRLCPCLQSTDSTMINLIKEELAHSLSSNRYKQGLERESTRGRKKKARDNPADQPEPAVEDSGDILRFFKDNNINVVGIRSSPDDNSVIGKGFLKCTDSVLIEGQPFAVVTLTFKKPKLSGDVPFWYWPNACSSTQFDYLQTASNMAARVVYAQSIFRLINVHDVVAVPLSLLCEPSRDKAARIQNETVVNLLSTPSPSIISSAPTEANALVAPAATAHNSEQASSSANREANQSVDIDNNLEESESEEDEDKLITSPDYSKALLVDSFVLYCLPGNWYLVKVCQTPADAGNETGCYLFDLQELQRRSCDPNKGLFSSTGTFHD